MPKRFYSQSLCLLTDGRTNIDDIKAALVASEFPIAREVPASEDLWLSGPAVLIAFRPEVNGYVSVDVVNQPWPDAMGDPSSDPNALAAWSMGFFGPFVFPGSLRRAQQHTWAWPEGNSVAQSHTGFVRLRSSYVLGVSDEVQFLPKGYNALEELNFLSRLALTLLELPGVICYFNPSGEVLRDRSGFSTIWKACTEQKKIPLPLWANIRLFHLNERFLMMDTVGNGQLDVSDVEAIFPRSRYHPNEVDHHLRNVSQYLLEARTEIHSGEAFDGPGENGLSWVVELSENGMVDPPRAVLRLCPRTDGSEIDAIIAKRLSAGI